MAERPVIMVVDDEPAALAAILDALTRRFGGDYRIVPQLSASTALDAVSKIKEDGEEIALVIADQWMPVMTGSEFLGRVRSDHRTCASGNRMPENRGHRAGCRHRAPYWWRVERRRGVQCGRC